MKERSVKTNMFENFIKQDVDDMIFGSTKQIISERWDPFCTTTRERGFFVFMAGKAQKGRSHGIFCPGERIFSCLCPACVIYFFG